MTHENDDDGYCAATNGARCYTLAIREIRLEKIRSGLLNPREDDAEEMEAAGSAAQPQFPASHRMSA